MAHSKASRLFDIRNIIGALLACYGVVLTVAGFAPGLLREHDDPSAATNKVDLYIGTDANWWVGLVLIATAAVFLGWAALQPITRSADTTADTGGTE
jgi:hypothetical protein